MSTTNRLGPKMSDYVQFAAQKYGISEREVLQRGNYALRVAARAEVATLLRKDGRSLPEIGRMLGGYHHVTIMNLLKTGRKKKKIYYRAPAAIIGEIQYPDLSGEWAI